MLIRLLRILNWPQLYVREISMKSTRVSFQSFVCGKKSLTNFYSFCIKNPGEYQVIIYINKHIRE